MASTVVADLIERVYRDFFNRPQDQAPVAQLTATIPDGTTDEVGIRVADLTPEELSLVMPGTIVEVERELMRVVTFDPDTGATTVLRGRLGTAPVAHLSIGPVSVAPPVARQSVFDAVADAIVALYPDLWSSFTELIHAEPIAVVPNANYLEILSARDPVGDRIPVEFVTGWKDSETNKAVIFPAEAWGQDIWVTFKLAPARPATETDTLLSLGVESSWEEIVVVSAVQALARGREIDLHTLEYLTEAIEASGLQPGQVINTATALLRYREYLITRASRARQADVATRVEVARVI